MTGLATDVIGTADVRSKRNSTALHLLDTPTDVFKQAFNLSAHTHILPYETIDANLIFNNQNSYGFGMHVLLNTEGLTKITSLLSDLFETLPKHIDCTIILSQHQTSYFLQSSLFPPPLQCYLFFSTCTSKKSLLIFRKRLELKLNIIKQKHTRLGKIELLILTRTWLAYPDKSEVPPTFVNLKQRAFHKLIPAAQTVLTPQAKYLQINYLDALHYPRTQAVINCHLETNPTHTLYHELPLLKFKQPLPCPFWISFTLRPHQLNNAIRCFQNMALITPREKALIVLQQSQALYQVYGYQLKPKKSNQTLSFLSSLPFFLTDKYDQSREHQNLFDTLSISQLSRKILLLLQQYVASFDENQIPGYDDGLLHMKASSCLHRPQKRSKTCRTP